MLDDLADRAGVSQPVIVVLLLLAAVQIGLTIYSLADLVRRDRVAEAPKLVWGVVILLGNIPGSVLYLVIGRNVPPSVLEPPTTASDIDETRSERIRRGVDALYGSERAPS